MEKAPSPAKNQCLLISVKRLETIGNDAQLSPPSPSLAWHGGRHGVQHNMARIFKKKKIPNAELVVDISHGISAIISQITTSSVSASMAS